MTPQWFSTACVNTGKLLFGFARRPTLLLATLFVLVCGFFFALPVHAAYEISDGTVRALYHLENTTDASGYGYDLTNTNSVSFNTGLLSNAGDTGSSNSTKYLKIVNDLGLHGGTSTFSFWVKINTAPSNGQEEHLFLQEDLETLVFYDVAYYNNAGTYQLYFYRGASGVGYRPYFSANYTLTPGTWYYIVLSYDGNELEAFVNNASVGSATGSGDGSGGYPDDADRFSLFVYGNPTPLYYASAIIDEFVITNTWMPTSTRTALYNSGAGAEVCASAGCDSTSTPIIASLQQFKSDGTTSLTEGTTTNESTVFFKAFLNSSSSDALKLQIELSTSTSFTNPLTATSSSVSPANYATTTISAIFDGSWYWRGRALDTVTNATSSWSQFGTDNVVDFVIDTDTSNYVEISNGSVKALYHLENTADASGHSFTLTNINSVVSSTGRLSNAFDTGSSNSTKYLKISNDLGLYGTTSTFSFWANINTAPSNGQEEVFFLQEDLETLVFYEVGYYNNAGTYQLYFYRGASGVGYRPYFSVNQTLTPGTWYYITMSYDGSKLEAFVNNVSIGSATGSGNGSGGYPDDSDRFSLFAYGNPTPQYFASALIDELVVTDTWFPTSTRTKLYNGGQGREVCAQSSGCGGILSGTITTGTTWTRGEGPYVVTSTVTINSGVRVIVEPGVVIKFKDDTGLIVNGDLDVRGISSTLTYFTSHHDDSVGGDTNGDGTSTGTAGDWKHIKIGSGASTTINGTVVRYGGGDASSSANVWNNGGTLNVDYADISYADYYGLIVSGGTTTITDSMIRDNEVAIDINSGSATIASSTIFNNTTYGALQTSGPTSTMTNNFWGGWQPLDDGDGSTQNSGPYNANANNEGAGDPVSSYISFSPYVVAYLSDPNVLNWSPPGVNADIYPYEMRVGSSTQYQIQLESGIDTWNASSSGYVNMVKASSSLSSTWDIYVTDISSSSIVWSGIWIPSITSTPHVIFNSAKMGSDPDYHQCVTTHELGHALGLAHSTGTNIMEGACSYNQTILQAQDIHDFNLLWSPAYFWDPHGMKGLITE